MGDCVRRRREEWSPVAEWRKTDRGEGTRDAYATYGRGRRGHHERGRCGSTPCQCRAVRRGERGRGCRGFLSRVRRTHLGDAACRGDDGRGDRGAVPVRHGRLSAGSGCAGDGRLSAAAAEQRAAQSPQRCEERDPAHSRAPAAALVRDVTRGELTHQRRRLGRLALRDGGTAQHREMAVETRAGRAAPAGDRRHTWPAAHCYLFHVTPHPYEGTRPGQVNPIAPSRHSCIPVAGFTSLIRRLTITHRIRLIPGRVGHGVQERARPERGRSH